MNGRKLTQLVGLSVAVWPLLAIVSSVALKNKNLAVGFLALTFLSLIAAWVLSFVFLPEGVKKFQGLIGVYKPYLPLILAWALIVQLINLLTTPSILKSIGVLTIGLVLFIYIWQKTRKRNKSTH